jgi:hypothetical protein
MVRNTGTPTTFLLDSFTRVAGLFRCNLYLSKTNSLTFREIMRLAKPSREREPCETNIAWGEKFWAHLRGRDGAKKNVGE